MTVLHTFQPSENKAFVREGGSLSRKGYIPITDVTVIEEWTNKIGKFIKYKYGDSLPQTELVLNKPITPIVELEPITLDSSHKWSKRFSGNENRVHTWKIHQDTKIGVAFHKELNCDVNEITYYTEDLIQKY